MVERGWQRQAGHVRKACAKAELKQMDSQQLVSQAAPPLLRLSPPAEHDPSSSQQIHRSGDAGNGSVVPHHTKDDNSGPGPASQSAYIPTLSPGPAQVRPQPDMPSCLPPLNREGCYGLAGQTSITAALTGTTCHSSTMEGSLGKTQPLTPITPPPMERLLRMAGTQAEWQTSPAPSKLSSVSCGRLP